MAADNPHLNWPRVSTISKSPAFGSLAFFLTNGDERYSEQTAELTSNPKTPVPWLLLARPDPIRHSSQRRCQQRRKLAHYNPAKGQLNVARCGLMHFLEKHKNRTFMSTTTPPQRDTFTPQNSVWYLKGTYCITTL